MTPASASAVALVTGAGQRVGRAIALELARAGFDLLVHYHTSEVGAASTAQEIAALGRRVHLHRADLADVASIRGLVQASRELGRLAVLVNSAAIFPRGPVAEMTPELWDTLMAINLRAPFFCAQQAAELMTEGGVIINIADVGGEVPWPGYVAYGASKAGLLMLTRGLATAFAPAIRVNAVAPGPVLMPEGWDEQLVRRATARTLLKRVGTPDDVASAVRFLVEAPYITGETLFVDGGRRWG